MNQLLRLLDSVWFTFSNTWAPPSYYFLIENAVFLRVTCTVNTLPKQMCTLWSVGVLCWKNTTTRWIWLDYSLHLFIIRTKNETKSLYEMAGKLRKCRTLSVPLSPHSFHVEWILISNWSHWNTHWTILYSGITISSIRKWIRRKEKKWINKLYIAVSCFPMGLLHWNENMNSMPYKN